MPALKFEIITHKEEARRARLAKEKAEKAKAEAEAKAKALENRIAELNENA